MDQAMESGQEVEGQEAGGGQSDVGEFIKNLSGGLTTITQMIGSMPDADPADVQEIQDITDRFQGLMSKLAGGGEGAPSEDPAAQSPKASRAKAVPVQSMAGKPVSPAGY
jgi:hypothetical protein